MKHTIVTMALTALAATAWAQQAPGNEASGPAAVSAATGTQTGPRPLTRAEVAADRNLWLRAGLAQFAGMESYVESDPQYQAHLAEYRQLRDSPAYAAEVQRLERTAQ